MKTREREKERDYIIPDVEVIELETANAILDMSGVGEI